MQTVIVLQHWYHLTGILNQLEQLANKEFVM